jgi:membrane protein implicated in regulation of membrane protease activity
MKLGDILLLSLSAAMVIIGTHLTMKGGVTLSYPVFMFAVVLLFWYQYRKMQGKQQQDSKGTRSGKKSKNKN